MQCSSLNTWDEAGLKLFFDAIAHYGPTNLSKVRAAAPITPLVSASRALEHVPDADMVAFASLRWQWPLRLLLVVQHRIAVCEPSTAGTTGSRRAQRKGASFTLWTR